MHKIILLTIISIFSSSGAEGFLFFPTRDPYIVKYTINNPSTPNACTSGFRHVPEDCRLTYFCGRNLFGQHLEYLAQCPYGFIWDRTINKCNYPLFTPTTYICGTMSTLNNFFGVLTRPLQSVYNEIFQKYSHLLPVTNLPTPKSTPTPSRPVAIPIVTKRPSSATSQQTTKVTATKSTTVPTNNIQSTTTLSSKPSSTRFPADRDSSNSDINESIAFGTGKEHSTTAESFNSESDLSSTILPVTTTSVNENPTTRNTNPTTSSSKITNLPFFTTTLNEHDSTTNIVNTKSDFSSISTTLPDTSTILNYNPTTIGTSDLVTDLLTNTNPPFSTTLREHESSTENNDNSRSDSSISINLPLTTVVMSPTTDSYNTNTPYVVKTVNDIDLTTAINSNSQSDYSISSISPDTLTTLGEQNPTTVYSNNQPQTNSIALSQMTTLKPPSPDRFPQTSTMKSFMSTTRPIYTTITEQPAKKFGTMATEPLSTTLPTWGQSTTTATTMTTTTSPIFSSLISSSSPSETSRTTMSTTLETPTTLFSTTIATTTPEYSTTITSTTADNDAFTTFVLNSGEGVNDPRM